MNVKYAFSALACAGLLILAAPAGAQYAGPSGKPAEAGYAGPSATPARPDVVTILAHPKDEQQVRLKGTLLRKTGKETYIFSDGTGEIVAEIDDDDFPTEHVDEHTRLEITGKVDTGRTRPPEIEVDKVRVLK